MLKLKVMVCQSFDLLIRAHVLNASSTDAAPGEKPKGIKTHLRSMLIVPEMIGSIVGIYNGKPAGRGRSLHKVFARSRSHRL